MEYTVLLKPNESGGFFATVPALPGCESFGATEEEAVKKISLNIKDFLQKAKFVRVKVDENGVEAKDPWDDVIGIFDDDETFDDFQKEIKKNRQNLKE